MSRRRGLSLLSVFHVRFIVVFLSVLALSATFTGIVSAQDETPTPTPTGDASAPVKRTSPPPEGSVSASAAADAFEPDNTAEQAGEILPGTPQTHSISPVGDHDWVTFTLDVPSAVVLQTSAPSYTWPDTVISLYDASLTLIDWNDDGGPYLLSHIDRTCGSDRLSAGTYYVMVQGFMDWSQIESYGISLTASDCLQLRTPLGAMTDTTPRFRWTEVPGATGYTLWVQHSESGQTIWQKTWATALCSGGVCAASMQRPRGHGNYDWMVTAHTPGGDVPSRWGTFSTSSAAPELITPSGSTADTTPRFRWTAAEGATAYELLVTRTADGAEVFRKTYATRICEAGRCAVTPQRDLPRTGYTVRIQAVTAFGGAWSDPVQFTIR